METDISESDPESKNEQMKEIINQQYENQGKSIFISSKKYEKTIYDTVVIPHAADWNKLSEKEKFAYELLLKKSKLR